MGYVILLLLALALGGCFGYGAGWTMRGEQMAIDSEQEKARKESMRNHPAGKRLWVVKE